MSNVKGIGAAIARATTDKSDQGFMVTGKELQKAVDAATEDGEVDLAEKNALVTGFTENSAHTYYATEDARDLFDEVSDKLNLPSYAQLQPTAARPNQERLKLAEEHLRPEVEAAGLKLESTPDALIIKGAKTGAQFTQAMDLSKSLPAKLKVPVEVDTTTL